MGQIAAAGGSGLGIAGTTLYQVAGTLGLAAGAVVATGGAVAYASYRLRDRRGGRARTATTRATAHRTVGTVPRGKGGAGGRLGMPRLGGKGGGRAGGAGPRLGGAGRGRAAGGGKGGTPRLGGAARAGKSPAAAGRGAGTTPAGKGAAGKGTGRGGTRGGGAAAQVGKAARATVARVRKTKAGGAAAEASKAARSTAKSDRRRAAENRDAGTSRWKRWKSARAAAKTRFGPGKTPVGRWVRSLAASALAAWAIRADERAAAAEGETEGTRRLDERDVKTDPTPGPPRPDYMPGTESTTTNPRSTAMSTFPLAVAASEIQTAAARYLPETMWIVDQDMQELYNLPLHLAQAIQIYTQNLQAAYPIHPAVVEALGRAYITLGELSTGMQAIPALFKNAHADDIKRRTAPRVGEDKWNV
jgi:hypothetical protein